MPPNSITLNFEKMPTVTVDGKTHTFKPGDNPGEGFKPITEGGVTYSLVKDSKGHFQMTISGEPSMLEKYNFGVGKGRVTDAKFSGGGSMDQFFRGFVSIQSGNKPTEDYFQDFSIGGASLKDRTAFLQSGAWGIDQNSASTELQRLEEEAKKGDDSKTKATTQPDKDKGIQDKLNEQPQAKQKIDQPIASKEPTVIVTSTEPLSQHELAILKASVSDDIHASIDILASNQETATLRGALSALQKENPDTQLAQRILSDKASSLLPIALSPRELAQKTEANLAKLGLKANPTKGDGNCYFHAVGAQVFLSQQSVRSQVADAMNDIIGRPFNRDLGFPKGLNNQKPTPAQRDWTLLDASTAGDKAWGEDYHCAYVARAFDRPVVLVGPDRIAVYEKDQEVRTISTADELPKNAIILSHKGGNHWESAELIKK